jgi:hypothetical protein
MVDAVECLRENLARSRSPIDLAIEAFDRLCGLRRLPARSCGRAVAVEDDVVGVVCGALMELSLLVVQSIRYRIVALRFFAETWMLA